MSTQITKQFKEETISLVLDKIKGFESSGNLKLPSNYIAGNALQAAWMIIQETKNIAKQPVLEACTKESIANALFNMAVAGLNPLKKQCSFIAYGNKLMMQREYQGSIALAKRYGLKSVKANVILKGDVFEFETNGDTGRKKVKNHIQTIDSLDGEILGAYAIVEMEDGNLDTEIMTMAQIRKSWEQGPTKGSSPAHKNFPDQMSCKTVINRAVKGIINSSDDADLFEDDGPHGDVLEEHVKHEISQNANKESLDFEEADVVGSKPLEKEVLNENVNEPVDEMQQEITGPGF